MSDNTISLNVSSASLFYEMTVTQNPVVPGNVVRVSNSVPNACRLAGTTQPCTLIAVEDVITGRGLDAVYDIGETAYLRYMLPGSLVWGMLGPSQTITFRGDLLRVSAGNFIYADPNVADERHDAVAVAWEPLTTGAEPARIRLLVR